MERFRAWQTVRGMIGDLLKDVQYGRPDVHKGSTTYYLAEQTITEVLQFLVDENIIDGYNANELEETLNLWAVD